MKKSKLKSKLKLFAPIFNMLVYGVLFIVIVAYSILTFLSLLFFIFKDKDFNWTNLFMLGFAIFLLVGKWIYDIVQSEVDKRKSGYKNSVLELDDFDDDGYRRKVDRPKKRW